MLDDQPGELLAVYQFDRDTPVIFVAYRLSLRLRTEGARRNYHSKRYLLRVLFDSSNQLGYDISSYRRFWLEMLRLGLETDEPVRPRQSSRKASKRPSRSTGWG